MKARVFWGTGVGTLAAAELAALLTNHPEWTLSPQLRWALRSHTPAGRAATTVLVGAGSAWLAHHLITVPAPKE